MNNFTAEEGVRNQTSLSETNTPVEMTGVDARQRKQGSSSSAIAQEQMSSNTANRIYDESDYY